jgi:Mg/Co/Ni transporter MgtE
VISRRRKAEELLGLMEQEEQADVAELLPYEDDTAGRLDDNGVRYTALAS